MTTDIMDMVLITAGSEITPDLDGSPQKLAELEKKPQGNADRITSSDNNYFIVPFVEDLQEMVRLGQYHVRCLRQQNDELKMVKLIIFPLCHKPSLNSSIQENDRLVKLLRESNIDV